MKTLLFFNDRNLFLRDGFIRQYGKAEALRNCAYNDGLNYAGSLPQVFKSDDMYYMLYGGLDPDAKKGEKERCFLVAESADGLHFQSCKDASRRAKLANAKFEHEFLERVTAEIGDLIVDEEAAPGERYKLLMCSYEGNEERLIDDYVMTSGDGFHYERKADSIWNIIGTEPGVGSFRRAAEGDFVITMRPDGGNRKICLTATKDFVHYTPPRLVMEAEGDDEPLAELYGMPVIVYEGYYIGLLWMYLAPPARERKYLDGKLLPQLAFSYTGDAFQRCLKEPFIMLGPEGSEDAGMIFATDCYRDANGNLTIMAAVCSHEHGHFSSNEGCCLMPYRLREDGFVCMHSGERGTLTTCALQLEGEELSVNIKADSATCALYEYVQENHYEVIPGFAHEDCKPFSGDSTAWHPQFKGSLSNLKDKIILVEIKAVHADIYAIRGDFVPMQWLDVYRWVHYGQRVRQPLMN